MIRLTDLTIYRKARALGIYWDSIVRGQAAPAEDASPAADELVDFIHDLHRAWEPGRRSEPTDDPVLNELLAKHQEMHAMAATATYLADPTARHRPAAVPEGVPAPWLNVPARTRHRLPAVLAAAMLIFAIGAIAARSWLDGNGPGPRGGVPGIHAPASPDATPVDETLLALSIPAEMLPSVEPVSGAFWRISVPSGSSATWDPDCCGGPVVLFVVSGTYTVRPQETISVIRADGTVEQVPGGEEVTLSTSDGLLTHQKTGLWASNTGAEPLDMLVWTLFDGTAPLHDFGLRGWTNIDDADKHDLPIRGDAPLAIKLRQLTVAGGTTIPAPDGQPGESYILPGEQGQGDVPHLHNDDGSIQVAADGKESVTVYVLSATQGDGAAIVSDETLMEFEIPAEMLPTGDGTSAGMVRLEVPVGSSETWTPICCTGPLVEYVVSGEYTVRAQDQITVFRADGTAEEIAAGTAVTLGAGDGLLSRNQTVAEVSNTGTTPVDLLQWVMIDDTSAFNEHKLPGWVETNEQVVRYFSPEEGPVTVTLRRVEVQGIAEIPKPAEGISYQYGLPSVPRQVVIGTLTDGLKVYGGEGETNATYVLTTTQTETEGGTPTP